MTSSDAQILRNILGNMLYNNTIEVIKRSIPEPTQSVIDEFYHDAKLLNRARVLDFKFRVKNPLDLISQFKRGEVVNYILYHFINGGLPTYTKAEYESKRYKNKKQQHKEEGGDGGYEQFDITPE